MLLFPCHQEGSRVNSQYIVRFFPSYFTFFRVSSYIISLKSVNWLWGVQKAAVNRLCHLSIRCLESIMHSVCEAWSSFPIYLCDITPVSNTDSRTCSFTSVAELFSLLCSSEGHRRQHKALCKCACCWIWLKDLFVSPWPLEDLRDTHREKERQKERDRESDRLEKRGEKRRGWHVPAALRCGGTTGGSPEPPHLLPGQCSQDLGSAMDPRTDMEVHQDCRIA